VDPQTIHNWNFRR